MVFDLLVFIGVWLAYFSLIFFPLRRRYERLVGPRPPDHPGDRLKTWALRQARLRRGFIAVGVGLAVLPLVVLLIVSLGR